MLLIKLRGKKFGKHRSKYFDLTHTPNLWDRLKSDIEITQIKLFVIELIAENY